MNIVYSCCGSKTDKSTYDNQDNRDESKCRFVTLGYVVVVGDGDFISSGCASICTSQERWHWQHNVDNTQVCALKDAAALPRW